MRAAAISPDIAARVQRTSREDLNDLVRRATRDETIEVADWQCRTLQGGGAATGGVYRLAGRGRTRGRSVPWSVVLKVIAPPPTQGETGWGLWEREAFAYRSGLLGDLPGGIRAPRCLRVSLDPAGGIWLWLEDVAERRGPCWSLARYADAAAALGAFNAAYLETRRPPSYAWLSRGWLRDYVEAASPVFARLREDLAHPLVRRLYPGDSADRLLDWWEKREPLLDWLDAQPQVLCHLDANRRNLLDGGSAERAQTVAVDWAFVGRGAVGQELAALVVGSVLLYEAEIRALVDLEATAVEAYVRGLRLGGWRGDERDVLFAYAATAALRYAAYCGLRLPTILDERQHAWAERVLGHPVPAFLDRLAIVRGAAIARAEAVCGGGELPKRKGGGR